MMPEINMEEIAGSHHILFICIDALRYDVAYEEEKNGGTPVLNKYGKWRKCQAPGNFTYPSHQAMFAGFFPIDEGIAGMKEREKLFFSPDIGMGRKAPAGAFLFSRPTWVQGLEDIGYETYCIGGVAFFDKRTETGSVLPSFFKHSYWYPKFGCKVKGSTANQVDFALKKLAEEDNSKKIMMYINISAIHYPNYFYGTNGEKQDSTDTHRLALRYVDSQLERLFDGFAEKGDTFVICCSDHGTCYGEDGVWFHGINHPLVNTVPYKHFIIKGSGQDRNQQDSTRYNNDITRNKNIAGDNMQDVFINNPVQEVSAQDKEIQPKGSSWQYVQYMYSYPHKTAYRDLPGINLADRLGVLKDFDNSFYMHIPFCQYKCGYCNLFSVAGMENRVSFMEDYIYTMERQAEQLAGVMPEGVIFNEMAVGGGTPLILPLHLLKQLFVIATKYFGIKCGRVPVSFETSPNQTSKEKLGLLKENGVTRISIGVQSFNKIELKKLHRFHSPERAMEALKDIKTTGFECVNIDIIYGIPGQTRYTLLKSLEKAVLFEPEELFIYPLYVKYGTYLYKTGVKPSADTMGLYICARDFLLSNGYIQKSMRRFEKAGSKIAETSSPSCGFGNTVSIGCGGRSYIGNLHFCTPYTVENAGCLKNLSAYIKQKDFLTIGHGFILTEDEIKRHYAVKNILFGNGIDREDYRKHFNSEAEEDFPVIKEWQSQGYASADKEFISLTQEGTALSDYLGPAFISGDTREKMDSWKCQDGGL